MSPQTDNKLEKQAIKMPSLSDTMESGHLVRWLKKPGDKISKGDVLAEIESDKSVMDMEAFDEGYLVGPLAKEDTDIPVGEVIAYISKQAPGSETTVAAQPLAEKTASPAPAVESTSTTTKQTRDAEAVSVETASAEAAPATAEKTLPAGHGHYRASPYARGLARELGVDLAMLSPGPDGIIKSPQVIAAAMQGPQPDLDAGPPWRYRLFTPMHRAIAGNMSATTSTPVFHISIRVPTTALLQLAKQTQQSLTLMLARALARSVVQHPDMNAAYTPVGLAVRKQVDVGIAVDRPGGLITPVLRDMAERPLTELADDWQQLKQKAKSGRLQPGEYQGATIYLSNLGMFEGISRFNAIVPSGACAILAVAASEAGTTEMTLSVDHRVVYGAEAARFMQTLKTNLLSPEKL